MKIVVCVSDGGGLTFNNRRQSKDVKMIENLSNLTEDSIVYTNDFSAPLFEDSTLSVLSVSNPLDSAGKEDYVFAENFALNEKKEEISRLVIYKWNRKYPYDRRLDVSPEEMGMSLVETIDFEGKSHEKITREIWER